MLGSNLIVSWSGRVNSDGWTTLGLLTQDIVITDFQISNNNGICPMFISTTTDTSNILLGGAMSMILVLIKANLQLDTCFCRQTLYLYHDQYNDYCYYNISGYYTH